MANEKRLIDADAFLKALNETPLDFVDVGGDFGFFDETIDSVMNEQPTIDAVEVVRCKDCQRAENHGADHEVFCNLICAYMGNNDFCSYGERRAEDG